jgi:ketosteroid isomerase-like protein
MSSQLPENWPSQFAQYLNACNLEAVVALYETDAQLVAQTGETVVGRDRIRDVVAGLIRAETRLRSQVLKTIHAGEIALLYTDFHGTTIDTSRKTIAICYRAIEVLRRQLDGTWKLIIGDPNGRGATMTRDDDTNSEIYVVDEDLKQMTREQLIYEVQRLRHGIRQHRDSGGHNLCWHQPGLWGMLPEATDPLPVVPEWPEFINGCVKYRQSLDEQAQLAPRTSEPYPHE